MIFALINAGLLLYSINAVAQSATIGSNFIAAAGNSPTADLDSIAKMVSAGLGTTSLVGVQEIDVELLANDPLGGFAVNANGTPTIATQNPDGSACTGGPSGGQCIDEYAFTQSGGTITVNVLNPQSPCASASKCPPSLPELRSVTNGSDAQGTGCSYMALKITYRYDFKGAPAGGLTLSTLKTFRLEPQS